MGIFREMFESSNFQTIEDLNLNCNQAIASGDYKNVMKIAKGFNTRVSKSNSFNEEEKLLRMAHGYKWICKGCFKILSTGEKKQEKELLMAFFACHRLAISNLYPARYSGDIFRKSLKRKFLDKKLYNEINELYDKLYEEFSEEMLHEIEIEANEQISGLPSPTVICDE